MKLNARGGSSPHSLAFRDPESGIGPLAGVFFEAAGNVEVGFHSFARVKLKPVKCPFSQRTTPDHPGRKMG